MLRIPSLILLSIFASGVSAQSANGGRKQFETRCAPCHGSDGNGGDHGPGIVDRRNSRSRTPQGLKQVIRGGIVDAGMPAFPDVSDAEIAELAEFVISLRAPAAEHPTAGDADAGRRYFFGVGGCSKCHMIRGVGGILGPDLSAIGRDRRISQIEAALRHPGTAPGSYRVVSVRLRNGRTIRGLVRNESDFDLQLQSLNGAMHFLAREQIASETYQSTSVMPPVRADPQEMRNLLAFLSRMDGRNTLPAYGNPPAIQLGELPFSAIVAPKPGDWPTYNGRLTGNRYSALAAISTGNVAGLAARWLFPVGDARRLEVTPLVVNGVMYVTAANEVFALDAKTGRQIWRYGRPLTKGVIGDAAGAINRGVALLGDRLFMVTDNAHLLALNRFNGGLVWDVEMADYRQHYGATSAPLVVEDLVVSGSSGGDEGTRGFIDAYKADTGERVWRVWTVPARGEPLAETWKGRALEHGCADAWLTGSYDPESRLIFWPTGNPCPDYNGDERIGDNLYSSSVLAIQADNGKIRWHYQFTPHDVHDWDAAQPLLVVDANFEGRRRKLLLQANRNGFFYVLDRETGKALLAKPFIHNLTWASGIGPDGRPQLLPGNEPTAQGTRTCPSVVGGTNWMSSAFNPSTRLFYVMALESCDIYTKNSEWWKPGESFYGGATRRAPDESRKIVRAIDVETSRIVWEYPQIGQGSTWGGLLTTAGGLVFFCDDGGAFAALDARSGKPLWHFNAGVASHASPMTYAVDGRQYVSIAAGSDIITFALGSE